MKNRLLKSSLSILFSLSFLLLNPGHSVAFERLTITFAVDASGSMRGEKIRQIQQSVEQITNSLDSSARFSLITFSNEVEVLISNTSDRDQLISALQSIRPAGNTSLYDGLDQALLATPNAPSSVIILFSDGEDNASSISRSKLPTMVDEFQGLVVLVGLGDSQVLLTRLNEIAGSEGKVFSVLNLGELTERIDAIIKPTVANVLKVTKSKSEQSNEDYLQLTAILIIATILLLLSGWFLLKERSEQKERIRLISAYDPEKSEHQEKSLYFRLLRLPYFAKYVAQEERRLLAAGLNLDVRNWLYLQVGVFLALFLLFQTIGLSPIFAFLLAGIGGFGIGSIYLNSTRKRKASAFAEELPDVLTIIASSLQSGLSFTQALTSVARESDGEVALQFRRVLSEVQVGRNLIDSLQDVADRMDSQDFNWTISALTIQREIGGNLSEILSTTAEAIRGRAEIRNEVKALSAEGRMSAYVLIAIPVFMLLYLRLTRPDAFGLMFSTAPGLVMMTIVVILMLIGWAWVQKVVRIKL